MTRTRFVAGELPPGQLIAEIPFSSVVTTKTLGGAGGWTATIAHDHPAISGDNRSRLTPNQRALWVLEDDGIAFGGLVRQPSVDLTDEGDLTIGGDGLWGYFRGDGSTTGRFWTLPDHTYTGHAFDAITGILADLIAAVPGIDLDVSWHGGGTGPAIADLELLNENADHIGTVIEKLCNDYGIQFDTDYRWHPSTTHPPRPGGLQSFHYPRRGRDTNIVLEHGVNVDAVRWAADGLQQANYAIGIGAGHLRQDASVPHNGFPRIETLVADKDTTSAGRLTTAVEAALDAREDPAKTCRVEVRRDNRSNIGPLITGDTVIFLIDDGYLQEDDTTRWRVDTIETTYDTEGEPTIAYELSAGSTLARAVPVPKYRILDRIREIEAAVAATQRLV